MSVKEEIRSQFIGALLGAKFPIHAPEELQNAIQTGAETRYKADDVEMTAELAEYLLEYEDYPLSSAEQAADIIVERAGLKSSPMFSLRGFWIEHASSVVIWVFPAVGDHWADSNIASSGPCSSRAACRSPQWPRYLWHDSKFLSCLSL